MGIGFGQHVHVPAFRGDERAVVSAICATSLGRATAAAERLAIPRAYGSWQDLIADPEIDVVSISVPPVLQPAIAIAAVAAGKHVLCEKPLAGDAAQGERMLAAVRAAGVVHAVDFEFRETRAWQRAKAIREQGLLGKVRHVAVSWRVETHAYRQPGDSWKLRTRDGGGTVNLFVSHCLDYIDWVVGRITRIAARFAPRGAPAEAQVDAWFELADGTPVTLSVAANAMFGSGHCVEIYGDAGTLVLENRSADYINGFELRLGTRGGALLPVDLDGPANTGDGRVVAVGGLVRRFLDAIGSGGELRPNFEDGLRVQLLIDKLRRANQEGTWLS